MPKISVNGKQLMVDSGENLMEALRRAEIFVDAPCGGKGRCGKCKVYAKGELNAVTDTERELLSKSELDRSVRLSCLCIVEGDVVVDLIGTGKMETEIAHSIPIELELSDAGKNDVGLAVDIGTTTVAAYFYSLYTGKLLGIHSGMNLQREYGADVISRIRACDTDQNALESQRLLITEQLNSYINSFKAGFPSSRITNAVIAANTTMLHLLTGLNPSGIARAPYTPESLFGIEYTGKQLGLDFDGTVYLAPCISAYVGADITAGIVGYGLDRQSDICLFIDIGTNGEMALILPDEICCCSTAAGPAFEGAHIKHGTGSVPGAINRIWVENGDIAFTTIANEPCAGICGSGLIDAIAAMLTLGVIDETGLLCDASETTGTLARRISDDGFLLDFTSGTAVTQQDIREVQLAKAAIAAGIQSLLHYANTPVSGIIRAVIAGGFGAHINPASAVKIGLLPRELSGLFEMAGNASGLGASFVMLNRTARERIEMLPEKCRNIELSGDSFFGDAYIENMCFES